MFGIHFGSTLSRRWIRNEADAVAKLRRDISSVLEQYRHEAFFEAQLRAEEARRRSEWGEVQHWTRVGHEVVRLNPRMNQNYEAMQAYIRNRLPD